MKNIWLIIATVSVIGNIALALMVINVTKDPTKGFSSQQIEEQQQFPYLSKRIFTEQQNDILINFIPLRQAMQDYVGQLNNNVGVYFEYLPSGTSIGANDRKEVDIASLSKVTLAMSVLKKIERGKLSKNETLVIEEKHIDSKFGDLWKKGPGARISVEELVNLSLTESDNTAFRVLLDALTIQEVGEVYEGLDVQVSVKDFYLQVSPKNYASILRSLYLSSFLSKENSNLVLDILTKTPFNDKIDAGVPNNIKIAHKIGVFEGSDNSRDVFIDCGIVYVPERPYILCIFVQDTENQAQKHMSYVSKMVYGYVAAVKGGN